MFFCLLHLLKSQFVRKTGKIVTIFSQDVCHTFHVQNLHSFHLLQLKNMNHLKTNFTII